MAGFVKTLGSGSPTSGVSNPGINMTAGMTSGNSIIVLIRHTTQTVTSITDAKGNTYTIDKAVTSFTTDVTIASCLAPASPLASGDLVTCNVSGTGPVQMIVAEYSPLTALDQTGSNGSTTGATSGSVTAGGATTQASEVVIVGFVGGNTTGTVTPGGSLVDQANVLAELYLMDHVLAATGTPSESWTWVTSRNWAAAMATYTAIATFAASGVGAISSAETFGPATRVSRVLGAVGLTSSEAFGTASLASGLSVSGVGAILSPDEYGAGSYGDGGYGTQFGVATVLLVVSGTSVYGGVLLSDVAVYGAEVDDVLVNAAQLADGCVYAGSTDDALLYAEQTGDVLVFAASTDDLPGH